MKRRIPSLDGLRVVAIGLVMCSHQLLHVPGVPLRWWFSANAYLGVSLFFCLSGYLITTLLLDEVDETGTLDLRRFYVRRFLRIVPPFYAYIAAIAVLGLSDWHSVVAAATFTQGYSPWGKNLFLAHSWSLSIEEQFYVLWPAALLLLGRRRATKVAITLLFASPLVRVATHFAPLPGYWDEFVLHSRLDGLMIGCCAALLRDEAWFERWRHRLASPAAAGTGTMVALVLSPLLTYAFRGRYMVPFGYSLNGLALVTVMLYVVQEPDTWIGRCLNWRPVVHAGMISYGLYLWQQLFLMGPRGSLVRSFPLNLALTLAAAEISWWTIEAWSRRLRDRLQWRIGAVRARTAAAWSAAQPTSTRP